ncbi:unannotated protein [freshwater metagenome]|uniref:Unannotated protein n=1 Tax=freshwater metagenome TaxID=449393 RepID=A0A6J6FEY2_9ZZZZ
MDEERDSHVLQDGVCSSSLILVVVRDSRIQRSARVHSCGESTHGFFKWRVWVESVRIEDVDVVETHSGEALVERGEQILARTPLAVGAGPHIEAGLARDNQLVAIRRKIRRENLPENALGRSGRRAVIVGEIDVGHTLVESAEDDVALHTAIAVVTKVVPEPERHSWQLDSTSPAAGIGNRFISVWMSFVRHALSVSGRRRLTA